jgi:signal transduction histidine kinase
MDTAFNNLDFLSVGLATVTTGILGFVVFFHNRKSITNKTFLIFSLATLCWGLANFLHYHLKAPQIAFWLLRISIFFAVWQAFFLFQLFYVFPKEKHFFPAAYHFFITPVTVITSLLTLTPLVFFEIAELSADGRIVRITNGPAIFLFGIVNIGLVISGLVILLRKTIRATKENRDQFLFVLIGTLLMFLFIIIFNFILPAFFDITVFISLGAVFTLPFVGLTAYAVIRHHLLNIKVITTEIVTFFLAVGTFLQIFFSHSLQEIILRVGVFIVMLIFGILLMRSVLKEVEAREEIERLAADLSRANERLRELDQLKSEFLSFASHQLRSPLTAIKGYASMILENSFGRTPKKIRNAVDRIFQATQALVLVVEDFLNISRIEQGRMQYTFTPVDLKQLIAEVIAEQTPNIEQAGLKIYFKTEKNQDYEIRADSGKIKQVVSNLIDNAVKYTPKGSITVSLIRNIQERKIQVRVADTGVGISSKALPTLFTKFGRDNKLASKRNVTGTGLGLYLAKEIMKAHHGHIWAESAGEGKGSTFYLEFYTNLIIGS